ncbi:MAG TPA: hypothetical protein VIH05_08100 [Tepidiformaceae bacterium]
MGRTIYTGITTRYRGTRFLGFNVYVSWRGKSRATSIGCLDEDCVDRALVIRERFWRELGKPATERNIRAGYGRPYVRDGIVVVSIGDHYRKFSIRKHGRREAMRLAKEAKARWLSGE